MPIECPVCYVPVRANAKHFPCCSAQCENDYYDDEEGRALFLDLMEKGIPSA